MRLSCVGSVTAGAPIDVAFDLTLGEGSLPAGGRIAIAWRWPLDFGNLQVTEPAAPNHLAATLDAPGPTLDALYRSVSRFNPWNHAIELIVCSRPLPAHGAVRVTCSRWQAPTCVALAARFLVTVQVRADTDWLRMVDPAPIVVHPGAGGSARCGRPVSDAAIDREALITVRCTDLLGNHTAPPAAPDLTVQDGEPAARIGEAWPTLFARAWQVPVRFGAGGRAVLQARAGALTATANPIRVHAGEPPQRLIWGDLHAGQGETGCGLGSLDHHFAFTRDVAGLQFASQ